jgi:hypothetical protein
MDKKALQAAIDLANQKLSNGEEPPWAWYQYMKLREAAQAILEGVECAKLQTENSPESERRPETHLRLVDSKDQQDRPQSHPVHPPVLLPM